METLSFSKQAKKLFLVGGLSALTGLALASSPAVMPWAKTREGVKDLPIVVNQTPSHSVYQDLPIPSSGSGFSANSVAGNRRSDTRPGNVAVFPFVSSNAPNGDLDTVISSPDGSIAVPVASRSGTSPNISKPNSTKPTSVSQSSRSSKESVSGNGKGSQKPGKGGPLGGGGGGGSGGGGGGGGGSGSVPAPTPTPQTPSIPKPSVPTPMVPTPPVVIDPPVVPEIPPVQELPVQEPPVQELPVQEPPVQEPPVEPVPPVQTPPTQPETEAPKPEESNPTPPIPDGGDAQLPPIPEIPSIPVPPGENDTKKSVLKREDLEYKGSFSVDQTSSSIALRRVGGKLRMFAGWQLAEYEVPDLATLVKGKSGWPAAKRLQELKNSQGTVMDATYIPDPQGRTYDPVRQRLYWSFESAYNLPPKNNPSLAYIQFDGEKPVKAVGPFGAPGPDAACPSHSMKIRGGSLAIPEWFAKGYLGGRTLGLGFGGYYSGWQPNSKGFHLSAAFHPGETTPTKGLDTVVLIDHDTLDWDNPLQKWGRRKANYKTENAAVQPYPVGEIGFWGYCDIVLGGGIWIDLPEKHGLLFSSIMGTGRVWYDNSRTNSEGQEPWMWIYNPMDLAKVAEGKKKAYENEPVSWKIDETFCSAWVTKEELGNDLPMPPSMAFDRETRMLFVMLPRAYRIGRETMPLVHCFVVK